MYPHFNATTSIVAERQTALRDAAEAHRRRPRRLRRRTDSPLTGASASPCVTNAAVLRTV
jgi:hypothetical protein